MAAELRPRRAGLAGLPTLLPVPALLAGLLLAVGPAASDDGQRPATADSPGTAAAVTPDLPVQVAIVKPVVDAERGRSLYAQRCATCHGASGLGDGPAARHLRPRPADLTRGVYKIRSTPTGTTPTDEDLFRTLTFGIPGTAMPSWMGLPADERWQLVFFLQSLVPDYDRRRGTPLEIPEPPPATVEAIERGRAIYHTLQCVQCHGAEGRGDGPGVPELVDDRGEQAHPIDFSRSSKFKGGSTARDIYRSVHTGLDGTPMKSFEGMITDRDTWALVHYLRSLRLDAPVPPILTEREAQTYVARLERAQQAAVEASEMISAIRAEVAQARAEVEQARAEAERAGREAATANEIVTELLAEKAAAVAAARAERERVERARAERAKVEQAKAAQAKADQTRAEREQAARDARANATVAEARTLFRTRCAACHGAQGAGDGPAAPGLNPRPRDFRDPAWQRSVTNAEIEKAILSGGPAVGKAAIMPANPDLHDRPELVTALRRIVRGFGGK